MYVARRALFLKHDARCVHKIAIIRTAILDRIGNSVSRFVLSRTVPRDTVRHTETQSFSTIN